MSHLRVQTLYLLVVWSVPAASHVFERALIGNLELLCHTSESKHVVFGSTERVCRKACF